MERTVLPENVQTIGREFVRGLIVILGAGLHGIYMYGATVFPDSGPIQDIDCHVILESPLTDSQRQKIFALYADLAQRFPPLGGEIDAYYILLEDAKGAVPPVHQLRTDIRDESWALHCAYVRAGYYFTLYGPEPVDIFPPPSWLDIAAALEHELHFIEGNLKYPAYCVLNLCRILYSFTEKDVVVSKRFSGNWACGRFRRWQPLVKAAMRSYEGAATTADDRRLHNEIERFLKFASKRIYELRGEPAS